MSSDDEVALSVARHLKRTSKKGIKQDIRRTGPLRSSQAKKGPTAAATDKQWLEQCQQLYSSLPKHSRWAKHKLKVCFAGSVQGPLCWELPTVGQVSEPTVIRNMSTAHYVCAANEQLLYYTA